MGGNFFEDFRAGQVIKHATPRTITDGDSALYIALTGARQPLFSSRPLALVFGCRDRPIDDMLVFNVAFGKTVPDISFNAVANLGYADVRFLEPVYPGDTLSAQSTVLGLRETSSGESGVVHVSSSAYNQDERVVLSWVRWVLVRKAKLKAVTRANLAPDLPKVVAADRLVPPPYRIDPDALQAATRSGRLWDDYQAGDRIDHAAGMTIDESDHTLATKLYQNNATVHFDALAQAGTRHGRRLVYGGHVISICRALSYEGLENVACTLAINGGAHRAPVFAGDTIYCFSEVIELLALGGRQDVGALRLRLVGIRNHPSKGFCDQIDNEGTPAFHSDVVLDLDYTVALPRRH